jgi:hypothetical protein
VEALTRTIGVPGATEARLSAQTDMVGSTSMSKKDLLPADPVIEAYKRDIDRTLIEKNLALSVDDRFLQLMELQRLADELRRAGKAARKIR